MKLYSINFAGYYPTGAVAIAFADSPEQAVDELIVKLIAKNLYLEPAYEKFGLNGKATLLASCTEHKRIAGATILLDGDY